MSGECCLSNRGPLGPKGSLFNPAANQCYLLRTQGTGIQRHPNFVSLTQQSLQEQALRRLRRNDGLSRKASFEGQGLRVQTELAHLHFRPMAAITRSLKNGLNFLYEINLGSARVRRL